MLTVHAVDALLENGLIVRAFQIGQVSQGEADTFNKVWNSGRDVVHGEMVGTDIAQLIPALVQVLKDYLWNVQL